MVDKNTPKKKAAPKKAAAKKKAAPKKVAPKKAEFKENAKDGDGDGLVQDGTIHERPSSNVIRTNDVKKASLRTRMAKWFKRG